ncbi:MAG: Rpn family recombination-promoting nuclease/putative transposase [Gammaproteobacteria bacterium]|nr:Rpn family recombination-promoting nuclease/putative transposase [Gammaproteobacteria bacterium]
MDEFYKIVFAFPRMVRDLVRGFLPTPWTDGLDLERLELLPTAYVSDSWHKRYGDRVWKVPYREDTDHPPGAYAVLLLEFQSEVDATMPVRMLVYAGLLMQELLRQRQRGVSDARLPRVIPVVIHRGRKRWTAPLSVTEMMLPGREMEDYQPRMSYLALDEWHFSPHDLPDDNLVSALIALETSEGEALDRAVAALATLLVDPIDAEIRRAFRDWIVSLRPLQPLAQGRWRTAMLTEQKMTLLESVNERLQKWYDELERQANERGMARGLEQGLEQGIEQGIARGREQALIEERALLRRMAERRFGNAVADSVAAMLADIDDSEGFAAVGDAIVDCTTSDELMQRLTLSRQTVE